MFCLSKHNYQLQISWCDTLKLNNFVLLLLTEATMVFYGMLLCIPASCCNKLTIELEKYGISGVANKLFICYPSNRKQFVHIRDVHN